MALYFGHKAQEKKSRGSASPYRSPEVLVASVVLGSTAGSLCRSNSQREVISDDGLNKDFLLVASGGGS